MFRRELPFELSIPEPCHESWQQMDGDHRERHCSHCDKQVHNFAAMTSREIERLIDASNGSLCARVTRRRNGSLVTLHAQHRQPSAPLAAQIVMTAALAGGALNVSAQSTAQPDQTMAILTGTVLKPDGSGPVKDGVVLLIPRQGSRTLARTDLDGNFSVSVPAGTYDIQIGQGFYPALRVPSANLHEGLQTLQAVKIPEASTEIVISGGVMAIPLLGFRYAVTHPIRYLKYLVRKI